MYNDRRHNYNQNKADQNGSYIFWKPCQHLNLLLWQNTEWAGLFYANPLRKLFWFFIGFHQHKHDQSNQYKGDNNAYYAAGRIAVSGEQVSKLIYN